MISRRELFAGTAGAFVAGIAEPQTVTTVRQKSLIVRFVGAAGFRKNGGTSLEVSFPTTTEFQHEAFLVAEEQYVEPLNTDWISAKDHTPLRTLHLELGLDQQAYRIRKIADGTITGGNQDSVDKKTALAVLPNVITAFGEKPEVNNDKFKNKCFGQAVMALKGGELRSGPPTGIAAGGGMSWRFPKGWIFESDPREVLSDCTEFVVRHTSGVTVDGAFKGIKVTEDAVVWVINASTRKHNVDPEELEHGKIYWEYYDPNKKIKDLPVPKLSGDFPKPSKAQLAFVPSVPHNATMPEECEPQLTVGIRMPPEVELCYQSALDFTIKRE